MKLAKVIPALLLAAILIVISACQGATNQQAAGTSTPAAESQATAGADATSNASAADDMSPVTFQIMPAGATLYPDGVTHNAVLDQITKETGVTISWVNGDPTKFQVMAASKSLPDIYQDNSDHKLKDIIASNQAVDLTDLIDKYAPNIKNKMGPGLKLSAEQYGGGTKVYGIPQGALIPDPAHPLVPQKNSFVGLFARYDIYQAVGSPKIASADDYLNVMKQMQDYQQKKLGDSAKVYAISGFIDWGAQWPFALGYSQAFLNTDVWTTGFQIEYQCETGDLLNAMEPNSALWQAYAWYNKAYQMGILDPEAFTQNNAQFVAKINAGTVLSASTGWWQPDTATAGESAGMYVLPGTPYTSQITPMANPGNNMMCFCISNNCKDPERAVKFLNYCYSDQGERLQKNGIQGVDWDVIDGVPQLIGDYLASVVAGTQDYAKQQGIGQSLPSMDVNMICADGFPIDLRNTAEQLGKTATKADLNFASSLDANKKGFKYPGQVYDQWAKDGLTKSTNGYPPDIYFYGTLDTSLTATDAACGQYMNAQYAKIILAKDDAAFKALKDETIAKMKSLGSETIYEAYVQQHKDATALKGKIGF